MAGVGNGCSDKSTKNPNCDCKARCCGCQKATNKCQSGSSSNCDGCKNGQCDKCYNPLWYYLTNTGGTIMTIFGFLLLAAALKLYFPYEELNSYMGRNLSRPEEPPSSTFQWQSDSLSPH